MQNTLSPAMLSRIRDLALEQMELLDELESALEADDTERVKALARRICDLEREVSKQ
jgi:hypothetical protein